MSIILSTENSFQPLYAKSKSYLWKGNKEQETTKMRDSLL